MALRKPWQCSGSSMRQQLRLRSLLSKELLVLLGSGVDSLCSRNLCKLKGQLHQNNATSFWLYGHFTNLVCFCFSASCVVGSVQTASNSCVFTSFLSKDLQLFLASGLTWELRMGGGVLKSSKDLFRNSWLAAFSLRGHLLVQREFLLEIDTSLAIAEEPQVFLASGLILCEETVTHTI